MQHLFLVQIGPVQSFIAAGRRTQDLYVGSRMLSQLAAAGFRAAETAAGFQAVFPVRLANGSLPKGVPHRFAFISDEEPAALASGIENTVRDYWRDEFAWKVYQLLTNEIGNGAWEQVFQRQMEHWLEFYWVAVEYDVDDHADSFRRAAEAMTQRKIKRHFPQIEEPGRKCTLTGAQSALNLPWDRLKKRLYDTNDILFRENEFLGTVALIKRLAQHADCDLGDASQYRALSTRHIAGMGDEERNPTEERGRELEGYFAVLHIDGDRMGVRLSNLRQLEDHQHFSQQLADFAETDVPEIVQRVGGENAQLIYAGGDDVLALLPLTTVLPCAYELRRAFTARTGCTASAGIAITPYDYPLDVALEIARDAEHTAKEDYRRDAVVVTEAAGTGQIRQAGSKWPIVDLVTTVLIHFKSGNLSGKLGYDLLTVARDMGGKVQSGARKAEITRLLRRRTNEGADKTTAAMIEALADSFMEFGDVADVSYDMPSLRWESVAHWTILARFLAQPTREGVLS